MSSSVVKRSSDSTRTRRPRRRGWAADKREVGSSTLPRPIAADSLVRLAGRSGPSVTQYPGDRGDGIPVARGGRHPKEPVERAEVADHLHVAPVQAEDEAVVPRQDSQKP